MTIRRADAPSARAARHELPLADLEHLGAAGTQIDGQGGSTRAPARHSTTLGDSTYSTISASSSDGKLISMSAARMMTVAIRTASIAGDQAENGADDERRQHGRAGDQQRVAAADDQPGR